MRRPPEANGAPSEASPLRFLSRRDPRKPLDVKVKYRGGPEAFWEIQARGVTIYRPGSAALHDVLMAIMVGGERRRETD